MFYDDRPTVFVLAATDNGTMIVSNLDWEKAGEGGVIGVACELFNKSNYEANEIGFLCNLLDFRRAASGDGVVAIDGGANNGCYTIPFARHMTGWGTVYAFEPQDWVFRELAGNTAINNCFNTKVFNAALGAVPGQIGVPIIDYTKPRNLGGVEMIFGSSKNTVPMVSIDFLNLPRLDLVKLDIEGMELHALQGTKATLARHRPILHIEHIKVGEQALRDVLEPIGYTVQPMGMNLIAIHEDDPVSKQVQFVDKSVAA